MSYFQLSTTLIAALALGLGCGDSDDPGGNGGADADPGSAVDGGTGGGDDDGGGGGGGPDAGPGSVDGGSVEVSDPGDPGSFDVHLADDIEVAVGTGTATLTICSPSGDGGSNPAAGPFPLVISSPGFQLPRTQYGSACEHLASWGFLVLLQDYTSSSILDTPNHQELAEDTVDLIDWALGSESGLAGRIDSARIATVGHSLGGKVSILSAILDDRIGAVVGWDPVDAKPPIDNGSPSVTPELMGDLTVPLAVIGETLDSSGGFSQCAPAADNYTQYYEHACSSPAVLEVTVDGADHMDWVEDRGSCGFTCSVCQNGSTDDAHTREVTRRATVAFLLEHLVGVDGFDIFLSTPNLGSGVTVRETPSCS